MMLTLCRNQDCPASDEIQQRLRELTLAHRIVLLDAAAAAAPPNVPQDSRSPTLWDDGTAYVGSQAILRHLEQLDQIKRRWDQFGADACYCDSDGDPL